MTKVNPGRLTAEIDGDFVVFLIGMRINKPWKLHKWLPVFLAMPRMLKELKNKPESGFLGHIFGPTAIVQYWRSFEDLEKFARDKDDPHLNAWRQFNKTIGSDGSLGIFHETFLVDAGKYEALYGNMPVFGLASAANHVPATGRRETARRRLGGNNEPAVASPEQVAG